MTLITMTTVGYGDYTPFTSIGKAIGCLCVVWGALMLSVMVVVLTKAFELKRSNCKIIQTNLKHFESSINYSKEKKFGKLPVKWLDKVYGEFGQIIDID